MKFETNETDLVLVLGVFVEEELKREQLLPNATHTIQLVASNDELFALVALKHDLDPICDHWLLASFLKSLGVNANREPSHVDEAVLKLNTFIGGFDDQDTAAGLQEVVCVLSRLEGDEIGTEHALKELLARGQTAENFRRWECRVHEEADLSIRELLADHSWNKKQVIVMDPDHVATLVRLDDLVGKGLVQVLVVDPRVILVRLALRVVGNLVVENWPENGLAVVGVVTIKVTVLDPDRKCIVLRLEPVLNLFLLALIQCISWETDSANPEDVVDSFGIDGGTDSVC